MHFAIDSPDVASPASFARILQSFFAFCKKCAFSVAPVCIEYKNKSNGKCFPKGTFVGAEVYMPPDALLLVLHAFRKGAKESPKTWSMPFDTLC